MIQSQNEQIGLEWAEKPTRKARLLTQGIASDPTFSALLGASKYRLGKLCSKGHDFLGSGFSLKKIESGICLECQPMPPEPRGKHPRSLANLAPEKRSKHKQRRNFTLLPSTIAWLEKQPNASAAIDCLVANAVESNDRKTRD